MLTIRNKNNFYSRLRVSIKYVCLHSSVNSVLFILHVLHENKMKNIFFFLVKIN